MLAKETFATSGPRMRVRFFAGYELPDDLVMRQDALKVAYQQGVPMGGDLLASAGHTPRFFVWASRATDSAPLQRLQIIKGWIDGADAHQQVFDVAGDASNGASVDLDTCTPQGAGADALCTVWTDPAFNPAQHAFYYARVVENPSCRWSTYTCNRLPAEQRPAACSDPAVPKTIQERAWTSPIWFQPAAEGFRFPRG